jgi:nitrate reductase assembly molybdenum cofactor insertion protein NarJ
MQKPPSFHEEFALVLGYPREDYAQILDRIVQRAAVEFPAVAAHLAFFQQGLDGMPLHELEELYIGTFDLNPHCALDLGWQLFGEDYNRGLFLAKLRRLMREHGLVESTELPDHLTHVLLLLARMAPGEAGDFAAACVLPALEKISAACKEDVAYRHLLAAVVTFIQKAHHPVLEEVTHG